MAAKLVSEFLEKFEWTPPTLFVVVVVVTLRYADAKTAIIRTF